jgi:hypothetical protein
MPNATTDIEIESRNQFIEALEANLGPNLGPFWYRGIVDVGYPLVPSLYCHPTTTGAALLLELKKLIGRFRQTRLVSP